MTALRDRRCQALAPGSPPLEPAAARELLAQLDPDWRITNDGQELRRAFGFADFYRTMAFVNAVAWIANEHDHHPNLEVGYNYCRLAFTTHSIGGLSENDFICAARIDAL
ncbi:MAG TPA: 4a-hydroxytetrahydrobiopterin dehydratase [Steroidobacteraceae bacterium]|nr:4a-hydroxytetrahydrobiopterin dehydratase [Steroidobacteraceae bacterium]